ncbi:MAG: NAD(P)/FAD-dependent oxidoreductase [Cyclobacteriaceae bacterium]|nr:NAD(P)/FAD-dependent oxidoreductase [Cyclobacteriaceae bacterium]
MQYDLIIVGGGAAGFFAAIEAFNQNPDQKIVILEKSTKLLSKVRISGGGRCNVTHHCFEASPLSKHYPRGQKEFKQIFRIFQVSDTVRWFERKGVELITEDDGRMFPITENSETIIECFQREVQKAKIEIIISTEVSSIQKPDDILIVKTRNEKIFSASKVLIAIGGHPQASAYSWIKSTGHTIISPIPSLFTFNDPSKEFTDLMGVAVQNAEVKIAGTKFASQGPVLITHWGLSGPGVIRLSAWAAVYLHEVNYQFTALINWTGEETEDSVRNLMKEKNRLEGKKQIMSHPLFQIPQRLWEKLCIKAEVGEKMVWAEAPSKVVNRLIEFIVRTPFRIQGKTTFKEEFVTCGGVDLKEIDLETMESKKLKGLFFAGEVLNVDGETGGFNFQSAWTTAFIAAKAISK